MKAHFWLFLILLTGAASCSSDDGDDSSVAPARYFNLNVNGSQIPFVLNNFSEVNSASIGRIGDKFTVTAIFGVGFGTDQFTLVFDKEGDLISADLGTGDDNFGGLTYSSYKHFPSHYFNLDITSLDETNKRIKVQFSGEMYLDGVNMESESITVSGDLDMDYEGDETAYDGIWIGEFQTNASALFNGVLWEATHENYPSAPGPAVFTAPDEYKMDIYFAPNTNATGTFAVTPASADNYIRLAKFNTGTLEYDYYDVTGTIDYHYKEFHGATDWTYFGNFSFTAVNPDNPSDVIEVTNGEFISYQKY